MNGCPRDVQEGFEEWGGVLGDEVTAAVLIDVAAGIDSPFARLEGVVNAGPAVASKRAPRGAKGNGPRDARAVVLTKEGREPYRL